jgi:CRP-like cAMP-binding protein
VKKPSATDFLASHGWLARTPVKFRREVLARLRIREFARGEAVYHAGDPVGGLWVIIDGSVEVEIRPPDSAPILVHFANPGWWFGEWPLIHDEPRLASLTAIRASTLATLPLHDCHAILKVDPAAWRWIAKLTSMSGALGLLIVADLMIQDPVRRAAALLLRLSGVRSVVAPAAEPFPILLSQQKIAHLANLSRSSITPILRGFAKRGYIELDYGSIVIRDARALARLVSARELP